MIQCVRFNLICEFVCVEGFSFSVLHRSVSLIVLCERRVSVVVCSTVTESVKLQETTCHRMSSKYDPL